MRFCSKGAKTQRELIMRSNIRIFADSGFLKGSVMDKNLVLPFSDLKLYRDLGDNLEIDPTFGEYMVQAAEEFLEEPIPMLTLSLFRELKKTGIRSHFESFHHKRRTMLMYLSIAEAYENKGRFIERIADLAWAIMDETGWVIPAHTHTSPTAPGTDVPEAYREDIIPGVDLYAGNCCATLALCKYLHKDSLDAISPIICKRIDHLVYLRGIRPFITCSFGWMGLAGAGVNNWLTNITSSILFATAVCVCDQEKRKKVTEKAMRILDNFSAFYPEDGFCDEGPGYWGGAGGNFFDCLELIDDLTGGKVTVYDHPLVRKIGEYVVKFNINGRYYLNFADAHPRLNHDGKLLMRYGEKCDSEELYRFGKMVAADNPVDRYYFFGMCYRVLKNAYIKEVTEAETTKATRTVWYDSGKIAIFRESEDTSRGMYLATKGGTNGEMHNHNDVGCLVVYYNGEPVIIDPSHGSYDNGFFGSTRYDRWYMKSSYHSIPTVDGIEQKAGGQYASTGEVFDGGKMTVTMNLKNAFPKEAGIESMIRTCTLDGGIARVRDEVKADHEADIQFNYLTIDEPTLIEDGKLAIAEGRTFTYDKNLKLVIEKVENTYLPYEDLNFKGTWRRECLWRITLRARACEAVSEISIY